MHTASEEPAGITKKAKQKTPVPSPILFLRIKRWHLHTGIYVMCWLLSCLKEAFYLSCRLFLLDCIMIDSQGGCRSWMASSWTPHVTWKLDQVLFAMAQAMPKGKAPWTGCQENASFHLKGWIPGCVWFSSAFYRVSWAVSCLSIDDCQVTDNLCDLASAFWGVGVELTPLLLLLLWISECLWVGYILLGWTKSFHS